MSAAAVSDEDDALAGELALGLLEGSERRAAERRAEADPAFRRQVETWDARLAPLLASAPEAAPRRDAWPDIERALPSRSSDPARTGSARRRLVPAFWRPLAIGSGALWAASLALFLLLPSPAPRGPVAGPTLAASIGAAGSVPLFTAVVDPASGEATLIPVQIDAGTDRVPELWLIAAEGSAPVSLGVVDPSAPVRVPFRPSAQGAPPVLAISLEPPGGSPTGRPTGPVVGTGQLAAI